MKNWRANVVRTIIVLLATVIVGRLAFLQILQNGFYRALAQGQQNLSSFAKGERGDIFIQDKTGELYTLASNQTTFFAFASPLEIKDMENTALLVAEILALDQETIRTKLQKNTSLYELLKRKISEDEKRSLQEAHLTGIYIGQENTRSYPQGFSISHVAGFTNQDGKGQYGIEEYYNEILEGKEGFAKNEGNPASYLLGVFQDSLQDGADVILTIDRHIQSMAELLLEKAHQTLAFEEGTIIVLEPSTGKVRALANVPAFNPNEYSQVETLRLFQNPAIQKIYEPGSIFKPLTVAAALDTGKINPHTTYTDKGIVQIGGRKIYNYDGRTWGKRSMTEVLEFSINTGAVFAEQHLGHKKFLEYINKFGIFEPTGIDLAGEVFSRNAEFQKGYEINFATASFGQGIEMTPMQIVKAFSALANNGVPSKPHVLERIMKNGKEVVLNHAPSPETTPIISPKTSSQITSMLVNVVQNGFAKAAHIPGYSIAGKTGTAQISWAALGVSKSGYSDKTIQSFIGYAPAFNPQFLILVKLDNPQTKTAEYSAVPIFRELAKYIIDYYQIPPDYDINS